VVLTWVEFGFIGVLIPAMAYNSHLALVSPTALGLNPKNQKL